MPKIRFEGVGNQRVAPSYDYSNNPLYDKTITEFISVTERRCPCCGLRLCTNHKGDFQCNKCGYEDHHDVAKYVAMGLNYTLPRKFIV